MDVVYKIVCPGKFEQGKFRTWKFGTCGCSMYSLYASFLGLEIATKYVLGEVTRPSLMGSKLFAYSSLETAMACIMSLHRGLFCLKCETENPEVVEEDLVFTIPSSAGCGWQDGKLLKSDELVFCHIQPSDKVALVPWLKPLEIIGHNVDQAFRPGKPFGWGES